MGMPSGTVAQEGISRRQGSRLEDRKSVTAQVTHPSYRRCLYHLRLNPCVSLCPTSLTIPARVLGDRSRQPCSNPQCLARPKSQPEPLMTWGSTIAFVSGPIALGHKHRAGFVLRMPGRVRLGSIPLRCPPERWTSVPAGTDHARDCGSELGSHPQ